MASKKQYMLEILLGAKTSSSYQSNINNVKQGISSLSSTAKKAAALITGAFAAVNLTGTIKDAVNVYAGFEQELAGSAAIAGATETEYAKLEKASREAGKATIKTAEESASALGFMALAGWDVNESTQGLMPVLKLSAATNLDLAQTSDLVTDSMSALKLGVDELPEYLDLVTKANNSANTTSEQLMEAFIKTGGAARTLEIGVQDTGTALGILANNGTKAEEGGRTLNAILTRIASNKDAIGQMEDLGVSIFDAKGKFVGLEEALKRINKGIAGLTVEEQAKALKYIAGTNYYSKMRYLLDGVKEGANGAESAWDDLESKLEDSEGSLDDMYDKMTDTLTGHKETMLSAMDDAKISFADAFDGELSGVLDDIGSGFNFVSESISDFASENEVEIHLAFEELREGALSVVDVMGDIGKFAVDNFDKIEAGIIGIGTAVTASKAVSGIARIASSLSSLASPAGILTIAVPAAVSAIAGIGTYAVKSHEKMIKAGLKEDFGDIALSLEDLDEIAQEIVGKKSLTKISVMLESIGDTEESIKSMKESLSTVDKISWKLHAGFDVDKNDKESYLSAAEDYVKYAQETIDNQGYTVSVATDLLLGKNSTIGAENDAFYSGLDAKLGRLQKKLKKKIEKAVKNGVDIDTDKAIQSLLQDVDEITTAVTDAENEAKLQAIDLKYSGKDLTANDFKQLSKDIQEYEKQVTEGAGEAFETSVATLNARLKAGDISQKKHDKELKKYREGYYNTQAKALESGSDYILDTIEQTYPEVSAALEDYQRNLKESFQKQVQDGIPIRDMNGVAATSALEAAGKAGIDKTLQEKLKEVYDWGLGDITAKIQELVSQQENGGYEVSKGLADGLVSAKSIAALTGSIDDEYFVLGNALSSSNALSALITASEGVGGYIPDGITDGMYNKRSEVVEGANNLINLAKSTIEQGGNFRVTMDLLSENVPAGNALEKNPGKTDKKGSLPSLPDLIKKVKSNAEGGIYYSPILTTFAEEGPEAAIPLDGSARAKLLWKQAGQVLGMGTEKDKALYSAVNSVSASPGKDKALYQNLLSATSGSAGSSAGTPDVKINYAPVIKVEGNADEKTLTKAIKLSQAEFAEMMEDYLFSIGRTSFSG